MKQGANKLKPATKGRISGRKRSTPPRGRQADAEVALSTLLALLHADRWLFEAGELAKTAGLRSEVKDYNRIRLAIVKSLNRLQPRAYGAMTRNGASSAAIQ